MNFMDLSYFLNFLELFLFCVFLTMLIQFKRNGIHSVQLIRSVKDGVITLKFELNAVHVVRSDGHRPELIKPDT